MKLQPASRREVKRMAIGCCICMAAECIILWLLSALEIGSFLFDGGSFGLKALLSCLGGTVIAVTNFALMCLMVQRSVEIEDVKLRKARIQGSYNLRLMLQAGWVLAALLLPCFHVIPGAIPLFFPTAVIWYLQMTGRLLPADGEKAPAASRPAEEAEDVPETFEV